MESFWTEILRLYIRHTISPDGRDTFESTPQLAKALQRVASRPSGDTLLDLGCSWGASLKPFANHFAHIIGVDCNAENLRAARQKYQEMPHISFMQGNLLQLPLPPGSVDLLVSSLMLHQVSDADQLALFQKIYSWLKDDGEMVFADELILFDPKQNRNALTAFTAICWQTPRQKTFTNSKSNPIWQMAMFTLGRT